MNPNNIFVISAIVVQRGEIEGAIRDVRHEIFFLAVHTPDGKELSDDSAAFEIHGLLEEKFPREDGWAIQQLESVRLMRKGVVVRSKLPDCEPSEVIEDTTRMWMLMAMDPAEGAKQLLTLIKNFFGGQGEEYSVRITSSPRDMIVRLQRGGQTGNAFYIEGGE